MSAEAWNTVWTASSMCLGAFIGNLIADVLRRRRAARAPKVGPPICDAEQPVFGKCIRSGRSKCERHLCDGHCANLCREECPSRVELVRRAEEQAKLDHQRAIDQRRRDAGMN